MPIHPLNELIQKCKENTPSYFKIKPDGATFKCSKCGQRDNEEFIKVFTSDQKTHFGVIHTACIAAIWLKNAHYFGEM